MPWPPEVARTFAAIDANPEWRAHVDQTREVVPEARLDDLAWADAYAFGTPTRFGNMCAQMRNFLDQTGGLPDAVAALRRLQAIYDRQQRLSQNTMAAIFLLILSAGGLTVRDLATNAVWWSPELEDIVIRLGLWGAKTMREPRDEDTLNTDSVLLGLRALFRPEAAPGLTAGYEVRIRELVVHARSAFGVHRGGPAGQDEPARIAPRVGLAQQFQECGPRMGQRPPAVVDHEQLPGQLGIRDRREAQPLDLRFQHNRVPRHDRPLSQPCLRSHRARRNP